MFDGMTIQMVFLVVIGAAVLVVGTTSLRRQIRMKKSGFVRDGRVLHVKHIEKTDKEGYLIQNYYEVRVEYSEGGHKTQKTFKSVDEYREGDAVQLIKEAERGGQLRIYGNDKAPVFGPWILIGAGVLIIALPFIQKQYGEKYISVILALLFLLIGAALILAYVKDVKRDTEEVKAVIKDVLKWQPSGKKKWSAPSASYYPILEYEIDGEKKTMRSRYNSSTASSYKKGKEITLYQDKKTGDILERGARKSMLFGGIVLMLVAFVGVYSTVMMFLSV